MFGRKKTQKNIKVTSEGKVKSAGKGFLALKNVEDVVNKMEAKLKPKVEKTETEKMPKKAVQQDVVVGKPVAIYNYEEIRPIPVQYKVAFIEGNTFEGPMGTAGDIQEPMAAKPSKERGNS